MGLALLLFKARIGHELEVILFAEIPHFILTLITHTCLISVNMKNLINDIGLLKTSKESLRGVFDDSDLSNIFSDLHKNKFYRRIKALTENGYLMRFCRGLYVTEEFDLEVVSQKLSETSYISFGTVLADHLAIGSIPKLQVEAVKSGKTRTYSFNKYKII